MRFHRNAKLGLAGRRELVLQIAGGCSLREAAATFNVSVATAHRWWHRWRQASDAERASLSCLLDRSSRPARSPRRLAPELERRSATVGEDGLGTPARRRRDRLRAFDRLEGASTGGDLETPATSARAGQPLRVALPRRPPAHGRVRYARFRGPGIASPATAPDGGRHARPVGYDFVHAVVDDHSRLAYGEIHGDERAPTVVGFLKRALAFFAEHGIIVRRVMTDNAWAYIHTGAYESCSLATGSATCAPSRTARARTARSSASTRRWPASGHTGSSTAHTASAQALPHWLEHYNHARPHSSLGGKPPISRVHNVCG